MNTDILWVGLGMPNEVYAPFKQMNLKIAG